MQKMNPTNCNSMLNDGFYDTVVITAKQLHSKEPKLRFDQSTALQNQLIVILIKKKNKLQIEYIDGKKPVAKLQYFYFRD